MRDKNYMCELDTVRPMWTLDTGLCWAFTDRYDDPQMSMENPALSDDEKCVYLIRCALTDAFELDFPCNHLNCSRIMSNVCKEDLIYLYPRSELIHPYFLIFHDWASDIKDKMPYTYVSTTGIRCRGYHGSFSSKLLFNLDL